MKNILYLALVLLFISCSSDRACRTRRGDRSRVVMPCNSYSDSQRGSCIFMWHYEREMQKLIYHEDGCSVEDFAFIANSALERIRKSDWNTDDELISDFYLASVRRKISNCNSQVNKR